MKTISIPDDLYESADALAKRLGVSRSRLYETAVAELLAKHDPSQIKERLDRLYSTESSELDPGFVQAQADALRHSDW
jgi:metal-responsive CopG/Arc/MetJ family transcriptional regulator